MIHIAHILDNRVPPSVRFYRTQGVLSWLEKQSGGLFRITEIDHGRFLAHETNAQPYDIALVERPISPESNGVIQMCRDQGVRVWLDYDDNLLSIPDYNASGDFYDVPQNADIVKRNMEAADLITVATDFLRHLYSGFNRNVVTVPNAWNDYRINPMPEPKDMHKPVRMAWRGSNTHFGDLYAVRSPLAKSLQDAAFVWQFFGYRPPFLPVQKRNYRPWSGLFSYFKTMANTPPDFLFVPLEINDFNRAKSNCAWIEATIFGAVTVAPAALPEFDRAGVIRYKDAKHLETIFAGIKSGKYDKIERLNASREELASRYRLSDVNTVRAQAIGALFGMQVGVKENAG